MTINFEQIRIIQAEARRCAPRETIYALYASDFPDIPRYVGRTTLTLHKRLNSHKTSHSSKRLREWREQLARRGAHMLIKPLAEGISLDDAVILEGEWIRRFKHHNLLNVFELNCIPYDALSHL